MGIARTIRPATRSTVLRRATWLLPLLAAAIWAAPAGPPGPDPAAGAAASSGSASAAIGADAVDGAGTSGTVLWAFDAADGHIGFEIQALGVLGFQGHFRHFRGAVVVDPADGLARVQLDIDATSLVMKRNRYQALARSPDFFDVDRHPRIGFVSEPFPALQPPRQLRGVLQLRGVAGKVAFILDSPPCTQPDRPCQVLAHGELDRFSFGMRALRATLARQVSLHIRLRGEPARPPARPPAAGPMPAPWLAALAATGQARLAGGH